MSPEVLGTWHLVLSTWPLGVGGSCAGHCYVGGALGCCCFSAAVEAVKAANVTRGKKIVA
jgi:hypothetical protein